VADETCSAVPKDLIDYSLQCTKLDGEISRQGQALAEALVAFINSSPDPKYISSVPRLDGDVANHVSTAKPMDDWVGRVGEAFKQAGTSDVLKMNHHLPPEDRIDKATITLTAGSSALDSLIPTEEQALRWEAGLQGGRDASALLDAYNNGDAARMKAEIARLQAHMDDPDYLAGYFQALGPDMTRAIIYDYMTWYHGDRSMLQTYDQALATATHSTIWSTDFNSQLFPPFDGSKLGTSGEVDAKRDFATTCQMNEYLLRYGTFSTDLLQKAMNEIVLTRLADPSTLPNLTRPWEYADQYRTALSALARNPDAAAAVMAGHYTHALFGHVDSRSNVQLLLEGFGQMQQWTGDRSLGKELGDAILAAGALSTNADSTHTQLLQDIGNIDDWQKVPDAARAAIATLVATNIDDFQQGGDARGDKLSWQQELFVIAELNQDGHVDRDRLKMLNVAIADADLPDDPEQFKSAVASLNAAATLPIYLSAAYLEEKHQQRISLILDLIGMIPLVGIPANIAEAYRQFSKGNYTSGGLSAVAALADIVGLAFAVRAIQGAAKGAKALSEADKANAIVDLAKVEEAVQAGKTPADMGELTKAGEALTAADKAEWAKRFSGGLQKVNKPDLNADALAARLGGESRVKFANDPTGREFDAVSDEFIAQDKPAGYAFNKAGRGQAKATFEAAAATGRKVYYHFDGPPDPATITRLEEYSRRYGVPVQIDTKPYGA
jgi:Restriction endonuclease fold toxin 3